MRIIWCGVGVVAVALAAVGVVLPLLPTTPFLLVAAFAFGKSSPRLAAALENHAHFGPLLSDWRSEGAIAPRHKVMAVAMMAAVLGLSILFGAPLWILLVQSLVMACVAAFLLTRPNPGG